MKQSSFLLNKKIGEENHTEVGIVAYYKLDTPQKLAEICLDVDECTSFFRWRRYRKSILIYMNRYKADKKVVKEHKKMKKQAAHSSLHEQFHNILTTHAKINTSSNKKFRNIVKHTLSRKLLDQRYRNKDISRTPFKQNADSFRVSMLNILRNYQRRNPIIGYCQGMNTIVLFLLEQGFSEEECFWMLVNTLEGILPIDYYPNFMLGLLCDLKIFNDLLKFHNPKIYKKFAEMQIDTSIILTHWLVCLFTNSVHKQVLLVIWDHLFAKGSVALFKAALLLFQIAQDDILNSSGVDVLHRIEQRVRTYDDAVGFNLRMSSLYISKKGITLLREVYREIFHCEIEKDEPKMKARIRQFYARRSQIQCNIDWPICHHLLERDKLLNQDEFDHFILRQQVPPPIYKNYFTRNPQHHHQHQHTSQNNSAEEQNDISQFSATHLIHNKKELNLNQTPPHLHPHSSKQEELSKLNVSDIIKESNNDSQMSDINEESKNDESIQIESFLDDLDIKELEALVGKQYPKQSNSGIHKADELLIMRTPHICQLSDDQMIDLDQKHKEDQANALRKYLQDIEFLSGKRKNQQNGMQPESVQFFSQFAPREIFADMVLRDLSESIASIDLS